MATRYNATFKASGLPSGAGSKNGFTAFLLFPDDTTEAAALAAIQTNLVPHINGRLTSVTKQIHSDTNTAGLPSATANGGSVNTRVLMRNDDGDTSNISIPLVKKNSREDLENALEGMGLVDKDDNPVGAVVYQTYSQLVEGS